MNATPSEDWDCGWGDAGGMVFQKAYLEFFTSAKIISALQDVLKKFPLVDFHILNEKVPVYYFNTSIL